MEARLTMRGGIQEMVANLGRPWQGGAGKWGGWHGKGLEEASSLGGMPCPMGEAAAGQGVANISEGNTVGNSGHLEAMEDWRDFCETVILDGGPPTRRAPWGPSQTIYRVPRRGMAAIVIAAGALDIPPGTVLEYMIANR